MKIEELTDSGCISLDTVLEWIASLTGKPVDITAGDITDVVQSPNSHLFIMRDENDLACGMITVSFVRVLSYGVMAWIDDVFVAESNRGNGYGRLLVMHAVEFARASGASAVSLTSSASRKAANALYAVSGFEKRETNVYNLKF